MKKNKFVFLNFIYLLPFTSCVSQLKLPPDNYQIQEIYIEKENPQPALPVEFIGFKIDPLILKTDMASGSPFTKDSVFEKSTCEFEEAKSFCQTKSFLQFPQALEKEGLSKCQNDFYFTNYSISELENYKSQKRYLTFVEIEKLHLAIEDSADKKTGQALMALSFTATGIPLFLLGTVFAEKDLAGVNQVYSILGGVSLGASIPLFISACRDAKSHVDFDARFNIYIYDSQEKSIVKKESLSVNLFETFQGSAKDQGQIYLREYLAQLSTMDLLKKYQEILSRF